MVDWFFAIRRVKEGTSAVFLQSGLDETWWCDFMECYCYLRNVQDLFADGKTPNERRFGGPLKGPTLPFGAFVEYHPISTRDQMRLHQFWKKVVSGIFLGYAPTAGGSWKGDALIADLEELENVEASEKLSSTNQHKKNYWSDKKGDEFRFPICRWYSEIVRKRLRIQRTHCKAGQCRKEWKSQRRISRRNGRVRNLSGICIDRGGLWKGDILVADLEELKLWRNQKIILDEST